MMRGEDAQRGARKLVTEMINIKKPLLVLILLVAFFKPAAVAQDTMIDQVSYLYLEKLIAVAKQNYPRVKAVQLQTDIARNNVTKQSLSWLNTLNYSYIYQPNTTFNVLEPTVYKGYQAGVSINIGNFLTTPFNVKQAKKELQVAVQDQNEYNLTLEGEVKRRYFTYVQALAVLKVQSKSQLDAQSILKDARIRYEKSELTLTDYTQALMSASSAGSSKIQAEAAWLTAKAALEELLTIKLEEVK